MRVIQPRTLTRPHRTGPRTSPHRTTPCHAEPIAPAGLALEHRAPARRAIRPVRHPRLPIRVVPDVEGLPKRGSFG